MPTTNDPEKFKERWNSHIKELNGLAQTLPKEEWEDLTETIDELHEFVDIAAEELEDDDL